MGPDWFEPFRLWIGRPQRHRFGRLPSRSQTGPFGRPHQAFSMDERSPTWPAPRERSTIGPRGITERAHQALGMATPASRFLAPGPGRDADTIDTAQRSNSNGERSRSALALDSSLGIQATWNVRRVIVSEARSARRGRDGRA
jgi:hypothetical protein